ncbi:hypothetical protein FQR65_LT11221 [Abscondita terminalis]|nr:hypothetical protein FQR65_LT11221 [Abscondita terminalis]
MGIRKKPKNKKNMELNTNTSEDDEIDEKDLLNEDELDDMDLHSNNNDQCLLCKKFVGCGSTEQVKWECNDADAMLYIMTTLGDKPSTLVMTCSSAKEACDALIAV